MNKYHSLCLNLDLEIIVVDFEITIHNSLSTVFPNSRIAGCRFHLGHITSVFLSIFRKSNLKINVKLAVAIIWWTIVFPKKVFCWLNSAVAQKVAQTYTNLSLMPVLCFYVSNRYLHKNSEFRRLFKNTCFSRAQT